MATEAWKCMKELVEQQAEFQTVIITATMDECMEIRNELLAGNVWIADDVLIVSDGSFELKCVGHDSMESEDEKTFVIRSEGITVKFILS